MFCCQHILAGAALADSVYELFAVCVTQFQHRLLAVLSVKIRTKQAMHGCLSQWSTLLLQGMGNVVVGTIGLSRQRKG